MASSARIPGVRTRYVTDLNQGPLVPRGGRKFVVLGGGICGLIAARELMLRGCSVTLIESESSIEAANDVSTNQGFKRAHAGGRFSIANLLRFIWRALVPHKAARPAVERFWDSLRGTLMTPASLRDEFVDMGGRIHLGALLQCLMPTRYATFRIVFQKSDQSIESVECHHVVSAVSPAALLQSIPADLGSDKVDVHEFQEVKKYLSQWQDVHLLGRIGASCADIDRVIENVFQFLDDVFCAQGDKTEVASLSAD